MELAIVTFAVILLQCVHGLMELHSSPSLTSNNNTTTRKLSNTKELFKFLLGLPANDNISMMKRKSICKLYENNESPVERKVKVMIFVDAMYLNVFANWLSFYRAACSDDTSLLELICMDNLSHRGLERLQLSCSERSFKLIFDKKKSIFDGKLTNIWVKRMELVLDFLREGVDIVLSDTDAIWKKSPFPDIMKYGFASSQYVSSDQTQGTVTISVPPSDIIASRAWWPWPLYHKWGACICMGFIYLKSSPINVELFSKVSVIMHEQLFNYTTNISRIRPDDQLAVNYQLLHWNISWLNQDMEVEKNRKPDFGIVQAHNRNLSVTLLPHLNYVRHCHNQTKNWRFHTPRMQNVVRKNLARATIAHCRVSTGFGKDKRDYLSAYNLWRIPLSVNNTNHPLYGLAGIPMRGDRNNGLYSPEQVKEMMRKRKEMVRKTRKQRRQKALRKQLREQVLQAQLEEEGAQMNADSSSVSETSIENLKDNPFTADVDHE